MGLPLSKINIVINSSRVRMVNASSQKPLELVDGRNHSVYRPYSRMPVVDHRASSSSRSRSDRCVSGPHGPSRESPNHQATVNAPVTHSRALLSYAVVAHPGILVKAHPTWHRRSAGCSNFYSRADDQFHPHALSYHL